MASTSILGRVPLVVTFHAPLLVTSINPDNELFKTREIKVLVVDLREVVFDATVESPTKLGCDRFVVPV